MLDLSWEGPIKCVWYRPRAMLVECEVGIQVDRQLQIECSSERGTRLGTVDVSSRIRIARER